MRWQNQRQSTNVEDVRGAGPAMAVGGGFGMILIVFIALIMGVDKRQIADIVQQQQQRQQQGQVAEGAGLDDEKRKFVATVLALTEDVWGGLFQDAGRAYEPPRLRLFSGSVNSGCGFASAAVGPFYCPQDRRVFLDTTFFEELDQRFGAPGDFAQAYVIAHEVGHHVQNLLGATDKVDQARGRVSKEQLNALSVRLELQADFYAGVWAHHAQAKFDILERGDVEEALRCAQAIGDDKLQQEAQGYVVPDSFTHGSSEQRLRWFRKGFETGDPGQADTFNIPESDL